MPSMIDQFELPEEFVRNFAAWLRIEPVCRYRSPEETGGAEIADPLWMLARQWQTAEFQGEDAGSPVSAKAVCSFQSGETLRVGAAESEARGTAPLEALVERTTTDFSKSMTLRQRAKVGQHLERALKAEGFGNVIPLLRRDDALYFPQGDPVLDPKARRFTEFLRGNVVDGLAIMVPHTTWPDVSGVGDNGRLVELVASTRRWFLRVSGEHDGSSGWRGETLDHQFEVEGPSVRLTARSYRSGELDWYSVDATTTGQDWESGKVSTSEIVTVPTRIEPGGVAPRWWQFEDARVNLPAVRVGRDELAKLLFLEFALVHSDDWFSIPIDVELGNLARIDALTVTNVFGETMAIRPAARSIAPNATAAVDRFELFSVALDRQGIGGDHTEGLEVDGRPILYVPATTTFRTESPPLEEVEFARDEVANLVWAIEDMVTSQTGASLTGGDASRRWRESVEQVEAAGIRAFIEWRVFELDALQKARGEEPSLSPEERRIIEELALASARETEITQGAKRRKGYHLATIVPPHWSPFRPVSRTSGLSFTRPTIDLERTVLPRHSTHARLDPGVLDEGALRAAAERLGLPEDTFKWMVDPRRTSRYPNFSRLLQMTANPLLRLREETVPDVGLRVKLTKQRTRWVDGSTHVWLGRSVLPARGQRSSGLRFDGEER